MSRELFPIPAIVQPAEADLATLAARINAEHEAGEGATRKGLEHFRAAGEKLIQAKERCSHGKWLPWLKENVKFDKRTAQVYMRVASEWEKCAAAAHLRDALRLLTDPVEDDDEEEPMRKYLTLGEWDALDTDQRRAAWAGCRKADPQATFNAQGENQNIEWALWSWNPVTGCRHNCPYCVSGDTLVTMADGGVKPISDIRVGDAIIGTRKDGTYRRYVETSVLAHWSTVKPAYRVTLANGTSVVCSEDHRWLTARRVWAYTRDDPAGRRGGGRGRGQRPHLTVGSKLMGYGTAYLPTPPTGDYRAGYVSAAIRGDGTLGIYDDRRSGRSSKIYSFRLATIDAEIIDRASAYLDSMGVVGVSRFRFKMAVGDAASCSAIRGASRTTHEQICGAIAERDSDEWRRGFVAGALDAEGSNNGVGSISVVRIYNSDPAYLAPIERWLSDHRFAFVYDTEKQPANKVVRTLRINGGLPEHVRLFQMTDPAVRRKYKLAGCSIKHAADTRVVSVVPLGFDLPMFDITTGTGDFIANGLVAHNCYARDIANRFYESKFEPTVWPGRLGAAKRTAFPEDRIAEELAKETPDGAARAMGLGNVFTCSMADLFGRWVPKEWIDAVLKAVREAPRWNFLFLTKFPQRMAEFKFPDNAWVGTTVDCQARVRNAERAFRKISATVKWLSCEPLIEPLTFEDIGAFDWLVLGGASRSSQTPEWHPPRRWVESVEAAARAAGVRVYEKANLLQRVREYPGVEPDVTQEAPESLRYLAETG